MRACLIIEDQFLESTCVHFQSQSIIHMNKERLLSGVARLVDPESIAYTLAHMSIKSIICNRERSC